MAQMLQHPCKPHACAVGSDDNKENAMTDSLMKSLLHPGIVAHLDESVAVRHHIHAHPELAYQEFSTSDLVAAKLEEYGYAVHRGLGGTGVVGTLKKGNGSQRLGLRADMDALPINEQTGLAYASKTAGTMHACGHDGHTASLLAAAQQLAVTEFDGTLHLIFQPAEEGLGGARRMVEDGLFKLFPCDAIFAFHNMPGYPVGKFGTLPGAFMASSDTVIIKILGNGGHGSMPHITVDAALVASYLVVALQSIVARNVDPRQMAVVTVGCLQAGNAPNVIAETAELRLSVRAYSPEVRAALRERITALAHAQAQAFGARAEVDYQWRYPALQNDPAMTEFAEQVVRDWLGEEGFMSNVQQLTGSEDFSFMLEQCPGCYLIIGNGEGEAGGCMVHNPRYDFNDGVLPIAASYWIKLTESFLR
jgi:hippurate hydrolase